MRTATASDPVNLAAKTLAKNLGDPMWRLNNLYKITIKGDEGETDLVMPFRLNRSQMRFVERLWHRNVILKARQLGFTTLIAIIFLDHALFNANVRCGIIAQDLLSVNVIFRDKVKFAYENLPPVLREQFQLIRDSASELLFAHNNSSIRVATSMRSGTIHRLHVSEFGKICATFPDKAREVMTGSIPAVPKNGIVIIESTAEGREGEFYTLTQRAMALHKQGKPLTERDWRFHFFPWWHEPHYRLDASGVPITDKDIAYFESVEAIADTVLDQEQRAWYVATRDADFSGTQELMWQEYPSTPEEAFQVSTEGCYYPDQLTAARKQGRITTIPYAQGTPVDTFWDIGNSDGTAIWFRQKIGAENRFIRFHEAWGETYAYFVRYLQNIGYVWGRHYLPHDADHKRQGSHANRSPKDMLEELWPGQRFEIVNRVEDVNHGIQQTRDAFTQCWFDETNCKEGIIHLELYRREWNDRIGHWRETPRHDVHSEAADAFRQFGQALAGGQLISGAGAYKRKANASWRVQ